VTIAVVLLSKSSFMVSQTNAAVNKTIRNVIRALSEFELTYPCLLIERQNHALILEIERGLD
jgi:hypothetical protein